MIRIISTYSSNFSSMSMDLSFGSDTDEHDYNIHVQQLPHFYGQFKIFINIFHLLLYLIYCPPEIWNPSFVISLCLPESGLKWMNGLANIFNSEDSNRIWCVSNSRIDSGLFCQNVLVCTVSTSILLPPSHIYSYIFSKLICYIY